MFSQHRLQGFAHGWPVADGRLLRRFPHSRFDVRVAVSSDGRCSIAAIGGDGKGNLSPVVYSATGRLVRSLPLVGTQAVSFSLDGSLLATGSALGSTVVWAAHSGHVVKTFDDGGGSITSVAFSPDGSQLATGSDDDGVRVWGLHGEGRLFYFTGHVGPVTSVRFDPNGASVVSTSDDGTSRIFEVAGIEAGVSAAVLAGGSSAYLASAYVPGGARLVTGSADGTARLWDTRLEQTLPVAADEQVPIAAAGFAGTTIVEASGGKLRLVPGGRVVGGFANGGPVAFGGGLVATARGTSVLITDPSSGSARAMTGAPAAVQALALTSDGREVAAVTGGHVHVWDTGSGRPRGRDSSLVPA